MSDIDDMMGLAEPVVAPVPTPAPHGLMATALDVTEKPTTVDDPITQRTREVERWSMGFRFLPESCDQGGVWVPCIDEKPVELNPDGLGPDGESSGSGTQLKSEFDAPEMVTFIPFVVEGSWKCNTTGFTVANYQEKARRNLENVTPKQIEHEFWTGVQMAEHPTGAGNQALVRNAGADDILNPGWDGSDPTSIVAVSPRTALALLAQGFANSAHGSRGIIHMIAYLADLLAGGMILKDDGQRLSTRARGSYVVSGSGYPGTGPIVAGEGGDPAVPDENQTWVFGTGAVNYRLGHVMMNPPDLVQAIDRRENKVKFTAERFGAAVWDPCTTIAVLVDYSLGLT